MRADRTQYSFKYKRITAEDIQKIQYLQGLRTQTEEFVIATTDQFDFDILSLPVIIDDIRYKILDSYREDNVNSNGLFRRDHEVTTYLRIGH
jgi:hypothetical protein